MPLIPTDYPQRVAARGVPVQVLAGWESRGSSADHRAVVLHHTASSDRESPSSCANYVFLAAQYAPDYNVLVDRTGTAWIGAREKSNSSGKISSVPLNEARAGRAGSVSAVQRGLGDDTSDNEGLFAIAAQNNGIGEPWGDAMCNAIAQVAAEALQCLGLAHAGYITQHRVLTARKVDNCGDACPYDWQTLVQAALAGTKPGPPQEADMWSQTLTIDPGDTGQLAVPRGAKDVVLRVTVTRPDKTDGKGGTRVTANGITLDAKTAAYYSELWLGSYQTKDVNVDSAKIAGVGVANKGDAQINATISGT